MGGLALKNTKTRRYERAEFETITNELTATLRQTFKRVEMPLFYRKKESFGDADYILSMEGYNGNMREYITETFKPNEIFHNGNCWTFDYNELQVDLITVAPEHFDSNYNYLSYNDLGNYIGKIAHGFGFKYGQEGLMYDHNFKGSNIGRVIISKDYDKIYEFLGLDYNRWRQGFDTLEEIFEFVSKSKYFNWEYLQLENNNRINRERDIKRKSYMSFLDYIEKNCKDDNHRFQYEKDKSVYVEAANKFFPEAGLEIAIRAFEYDYCKALYIKSKFNGGELMRRYGLKGKEIGEAMDGFRAFVTVHIGNYDAFIIANTVQQIYRTYDDYCEHNEFWKNKDKA